MNIKLVADRHIPLLSELFDNDVDISFIAPAEFSNNRIKHADAIAVRSRTRVDSLLLKKSRVRLVASSTSGIDHIDQHALQELGIELVDAKGCNAPAVLDYILAVIATLRIENTLSPSALTVGVIGVGHVGTLVASSLFRLGFKVLLCDPFRSDTDPLFVHTPINELQQCDILTLHTPFTKDGPYPTENMITPLIMQAQNPGCVVINSARGEVLPIEAVIECLDTSRFVFDVYPNEPRFDRRYLDVGLLTTPHIAGNAIESKLRGAHIIAEKICDYFGLSKRCLQTVSLPKATVIDPKNHWEEAVLDCYKPRLDHAALQEIKHLPESEFGRAFHRLREERELRHEFRLA